ncbi:MAG TPA: 3-ketoacyl-ACP reductase [Verrucomicrobiae bacterium]|nr:3-ketoacyl-ACP reductase [Verrucomicrobiae bacterium]
MKRVAIVTGGVRGIGLGVSRALLEEGFSVAACGTKSADAVEDTVRGLRGEGGELHYVQASVASADDRARLLDEVRARFGALHVLVNNAGIAPRVRADLLEATEASFDEVVGVNLKGPYFLTQAAARWMIDQKKASPTWRGCIINVSSVSATFASPARGEYCISKAGISMATQLWAARLGEFDIPAYEVRPGIVATDMTSGVKEKYDRLIAGGLLVQPRWGTIGDVGRAIAMLARGDLPYSTGQVIMVDGGMAVQRL